MSWKNIVCLANNCGGLGTNKIARDGSRTYRWWKNAGHEEDWCHFLMVWDLGDSANQVLKLTSSHLLKQMCQVGESLLFMSFKGWLASHPLQASFPCLFYVRWNPSVCCSVWRDEKCGWNLSFHQNLIDIDTYHLEALLKSVQSIYIPNGGQGRWIWIIHSDGTSFIKFSL